MMQIVPILSRKPSFLRLRRGFSQDLNVNFADRLVGHFQRVASSFVRAPSQPARYTQPGPFDFAPLRPAGLSAWRHACRDGGAVWPGSTMMTFVCITRH